MLSPVITSSKEGRIYLISISRSTQNRTAVERKAMQTAFKLKSYCNVSGPVMDCQHVQGVPCLSHEDR